ncbi:MAG: hypothetical protein GEU99_11575 [Luteitalea sp.]|nr:hypothetical protein [Luteitalea sp.]
MPRTLPYIRAVGVLTLSACLVQHPLTAQGQAVLLPETWIGGSVDARAMTSDAADGAVVPIPYLRLGGRHDGWSPTIGLGWFRTDITADVFGRLEEIGNLRVRPYLVGVAYGVSRGRFRYEGSLVAGLAINHFGMSQTSEQALRERHLAVDADASNSFAVRPGVSVWYYVTPRFALRWHANYLITRPEVTIGSGTGVTRFRQQADVLTFGAGLAYRIRRAPARRPYKSAAP